MRLVHLLAVTLVALASAGCDSGDNVQTATATVAPPVGVTSGGVSGTVTLTQDGDDLTMRLALTGATPGAHGFHVHAVGSCAPADLPDDSDPAPDPAGAAMGHYDPLDTNDHGAPTDDDDQKHGGDTGNVTATSTGRIDAVLTTQALSLTGENPIVGRAVIVHSDRDDLVSDPGGKSGARVGCGVIASAI